MIKIDEIGKYWTDMYLNEPLKYKEAIKGHEGVCCCIHGCKLGMGESCPVYWNGSGPCEMCEKIWSRYKDKPINKELWGLVSIPDSIKGNGKENKMTLKPQNNLVELIGVYGGDQEHASSAWTSTSRNMSPEKISRIPKLLNMLAKDGHHTPFEKSSIHFLVTTEIASHIHIIKHRIGVAVNGESARYKELKDDKFFVPNDWDNEERANYVKFMEDAYKQYHNALERLQKKYVDEGGMTEADARKRAKESARLYLPYGNQIQADVMFNFRSFYHFLSLRYSTHAQKEIRDIARQMLEQVVATNKFKHTLEAFELTDSNGNIRKPFTDHFHLPKFE